MQARPATGERADRRRGDATPSASTVRERDGDLVGAGTRGRCAARCTVPRATDTLLTFKFGTPLRLPRSRPTPTFAGLIRLCGHLTKDVMCS